MTMPIPPGARVVELPAPTFPMLSMMFTDNLTPDLTKGGSADQTVMWVLTDPHPFDSRVKVKRMYAVDDGVEVYAASDDGTFCVRDLIQTRHIRFTRETMPVNVFVEEIENSESESGDDPEPEPELPSSPSNQVPS